MSIETHNAELKTVLGFSDDDLAANRAGKPTPAQIERWEALRKNMRATAQGIQTSQPISAGFGCFVVLAMLSVGLWISGVVAGVQGALGISTNLMLILLGVVILLISVVVVPMLARRFTGSDVARFDSAAPITPSSHVEAVSGKVQRISGRGYGSNRGSVSDQIKIGGKSMAVKGQEQLEVFRKGKQYRVYYFADTVLRSNQLASAEALEE